jgi:hypothetical protein
VDEAVCAELVAMLRAAASLWNAVEALDLLSVTLAVAVPALVLLARQEVRMRRLRQIEDFLANFNVRRPNGRGLADNPTFEFARSKYTADLELDRDQRKRLARSSENEKIDLLVQAAEKGRTHFSKRLKISAFLFILISFAGFALLHREIAYKLGVGSCFVTGKAESFLLIALLTFVGAYISSIRLMLNRLSLFDISSNTFLRISAETLGSISVALVLYAALADPIAALTGIAPASTASDGTTAANSGQSTHVIPPLWLALAFTLGLLPESATRFLLSKIQNKISFIKTTDDRYNDLNKVTSPEVIDGIDYEARFRLQDCGIYDVQNLAAYNPILLYIETPYGIYQCIDWIAQAQLCNIVGLERFMIFRELNVRTIFDLERAIDSTQSPWQFKDIYLSVLFTPTMRLRQAAETGRAKFLTATETNADFKNVDEFCVWCRALLSKDRETLSRATDHLLAWITDDLHVRRLRRLWNEISESLGPHSEYLPDSRRALHDKRLAEQTKPPSSSPAMFLAALAAHLLMNRKSR